MLQGKSSWGYVLCELRRPQTSTKLIPESVSNFDQVDLFDVFFVYLKHM